MLKNFSFIVLVSFFLSSCIKGTTAGEICNYEACAVKAPASEEQAVQAYLTNNGIEAQKHCSGMYYRIETAGTGKTPGVCDNITINYQGRLTNGQTFDESTNPVTFQLGQLILGWRNGIPLIKEGGRIHLYIPPSLGYGNQDVRDRNGNVAIPGGSILVFEVELKQVQ
jgi:FKBP-type peptidyl-prolyl cis-trans isomerase FkpA